jgi:hypothetical protein
LPKSPSHHPQYFPRQRLRYCLPRQQLSATTQRFHHQSQHGYSPHLHHHTIILLGDAVDLRRPLLRPLHHIRNPTMLLQLLRSQVRILLCRKCGRKMTLSSYTPTSVSCSVYIFMLFSLLLMAITIASFIIASDLLANLDDTTCDLNGTFNYLFDGAPVGYSPAWSGADNFNQFAQNLSINFPNAMPTLNNIFQSQQYSQLADKTSNSLYALATTYACNTNLSSTTVSCPFSSASSCVNGSSTQTPLFSMNYCNTNISTSSASLITAEENTNTTMWQSALTSLQQNISQATTTPVSFSSLVSQTSSLSTSIQNLKPGLASAIDAVIFLLCRSIIISTIRSLEVILLSQSSSLLHCFPSWLHAASFALAISTAGSSFTPSGYCSRCYR